MPNQPAVPRCLVRCNDAHLVAAAVNIEVCSERNTADEKEDHVECIRDNHEDWGNRECLIDCTSDEVEQGQHSEDRHKHCVVDDRRVSALCVSYHVSDQCHYEESPEELGTQLAKSSLVFAPRNTDLQASKGEVDNGGHCEA